MRTENVIGALKNQTNTSPIIRSEIRINNLPLSISGATGVGFGTAVLMGLPVGVILMHAMVVRMSLSSSDADIIATFSGDASVGTTGTADATLSGTDSDVIPVTEFGPAVAKQASQIVLSSAATANGVLYDNSAGTSQYHLNVIIDDASISGVADMVVNGNITFLHSIL